MSKLARLMKPEEAERMFPHCLDELPEPMEALGFALEEWLPICGNQLYASGKRCWWWCDMMGSGGVQRRYWKNMEGKDACLGDPMRAKFKRLR